MYRAEQASGHSPGKTWQNSAEVTDVADVADITVETGRQNMAGHGRIQQIAINCRRLRQFYNQSLIAKSVKTGGYM